MKRYRKYTVRVTRDILYTQSVDLVVTAYNKASAMDAALELAEEGSQAVFADGADDDDSWHYGEQGAYVADPDAIEVAPDDALLSEAIPK